MISVRLAIPADADAIWEILEPTIRAGETYTFPQDLGREAALKSWFSPGHMVFMAEENSAAVGTYFIHANQKGRGSHVANCGYVTAPWAAGRGVARAMCAHSLQQAKTLGFRAMQFNFVVSTNHVALHLWQQFGFEIVGRVPAAFLHPRLGYVDALIMYREL
jgi:GNAT superfamily N-acetyltransferase